MRQSTSTGVAIHPDQILDREALRLPAEERISFGSYFNAFPAAYWRRWTIVSEVDPDPDASRAAAPPSPSTARWPTAARSASRRSPPATRRPRPSTFELPLKPFVDGGWYWYDVVAGDEDVVVRSAEWTAQVPADRAEHGTVDICITTMNRPDFVRQAARPARRRRRSCGPTSTRSSSWSRAPRRWWTRSSSPRPPPALGDTLRVIEQGNLGGSGGYARGQLESVRKGTATYAMMMDDDVICEPEGIIRAVTFGDLARRPTIVGGHMFSIYSRTRLHSFGEIITPWRFWWLSAPGVFDDWDFGARNLRSTRWLHKRIDVDFNGWFMCLIPRQVLDEIGPQPAALHQVGRLRVRPARQGGGLPDGDLARCRRLAHPVDRQERRARLAGLLPPAQPLRRGAAPLAVRARRPDGAREPQPPDRAPGLDAVLHRRAAADGARGRPRRVPTPCTRSCRRGWRRSTRSASSSPTRSCRPTPTPSRPYAATSRRARARTTPGSRAARRRWSGPRRCRCASCDRCVRPRAQHPEAEIPAMDAKWYRIARYDSAVVSMPDGTSAALYQRDPEKFRDLMKRTAGDPRAVPAGVAAAGRGVPRGAGRHHLAGGLGEDLRAVDGPEATPLASASSTDRRLHERSPHQRHPGLAAAHPRGARGAAARAAGGHRAGRGRPPPLPAADAGAQHHPVALPGHRARVGVELPPARDPLLPVLLPVPGDGRSRRRHGELRRAPLRRHGDRALLHRDLQRRHPVAGPEPHADHQARRAPRDVPGRRGCWWRRGTPCR